MATTWSDIGKALGLVTTTAPAPPQQRAVEDVIAASIAERLSSFTVADALCMPAVRRGVDILVSVGASFQPLSYTDDGVVTDSPRIVTKPDPFRSRYDWSALMVRSLVEDGNAWLRVEGGLFAIVEPDSDVMAEWTDDSRMSVQCELRGKPMRYGIDLLHVRIGQTATDLRGQSPLRQCLPSLAIIDATEQYASKYFSSNGQPHTVLMDEHERTGEEMTGLRDAYVKARGASGVAALAGGVKAEFPAIDPERSQLTDSRAYGTTEVARLLGIPSPLMHLDIGSSTNIIYTNISGVVQSLARQTLLPLYMAPIEAALTELSGQTVRYSVGELQRVDVGAKVDVYEKLQAMGVVSPEQVAQAIGLDPSDVPADRLPVAPRGTV